MVESLIAHWSGWCYGFTAIESSSIDDGHERIDHRTKLNGGLDINDLAAVSSGKVAEVEMKLYVTGNCVHLKEKDNGQLSGSARQYHMKEVSVNLFILCKIINSLVFCLLFFDLSNTIKDG